MLEHLSILRYTGLMNQCENPLGAGNQQERPILSPDFLAGLIVGEGSYYIGIRRAKKPKGYYVSIYPGFGLRMNDMETLNRAVESMQAYELDVYLSPTLTHGCQVISVVGLRQMRTHLDFFLPLLTGKKQQAAEIVSEFVDLRVAKAKKPYTDNEIDLIERLREVNGPSVHRLPVGILRDYTPGTAPREGGMVKI